MATNKDDKLTRQPRTSQVRLAEIYGETEQGLHAWASRDTGHPENVEDDPTVVLAFVTDDELVDYLAHLVRCSASPAGWADWAPELAHRYRQLAAIVADEVKLRLACATDDEGLF